MIEKEKIEEATVLEMRKEVEKHGKTKETDQQAKVGDLVRIQENQVEEEIKEDNLVKTQETVQKKEEIAAMRKGRKEMVREMNIEGKEKTMDSDRVLIDLITVSTKM